MRSLSRIAPLVVTLIVAGSATAACGHAGQDPAADPDAADCIVKDSRGALDYLDQSMLSSRFEQESLGFTDTNEDGIPQTLDLFDYLHLDPDEAETVYRAASGCGVDFQAILARDASDQMGARPADADEANACIARAVTKKNVHEYVVAVLSGNGGSAYGSQFALWRTLRTCTPRRTMASFPKPNPVKPDPANKPGSPYENHGYFDNDDTTVTSPDTSDDGDSESDIQSCLDFVDEQAGEIAAMLAEGLISEADYERLMSENTDQSLNCLDLR